jgi:hypothetical protein
MRGLLIGTVVVGTLTGACVGGAIRPTLDPGAPVDVAQLWAEPSDIAGRDLLHGEGGRQLLPDASAAFAFVKEDSNGYSRGFDVTGSDGRSWSVKLGPEAQSEVAVSRILWAIGYHQPALYYVPSWTLTGGPGGTHQSARFRLEQPDEKVIGDWSWYENPFVETQPFKGLVIANIMLNNWDWKTSNNKIYASAGAPAARRYVVRDLGASLGKTDYPALLRWLPTKYIKQGSRNNVDDFEAQGFIRSVEGDRVDFHYRGIHRSLIDTLTAADVVWTAQLMSRLSDDQIGDAFRAGGYSEDHIRRYTAKLRAKIAEALALGGA